MPPELAVYGVDAVIEERNSDALTQRLQTPILEVCCPDALDVLRFHRMDHALADVFDLVCFAILSKIAFDVTSHRHPCAAFF